MMTSCNPVKSTRSSHKVSLLVVQHQKSNKYSEKAFALSYLVYGMNYEQTSFAAATA